MQFSCSTNSVNALKEKQRCRNLEIWDKFSSELLVLLDGERDMQNDGAFNVTQQLCHIGVTATHSKLFLTATSHQRSTSNLYKRTAVDLLLLSVLWRCWLSVWKSIRPVKNSVMRCWCGYLSGARCKWLAYGPVVATATLSSLASLKSRMIFTFLVLADPGCSGKEAVKQVFVFTRIHKSLLLTSYIAGNVEFAWWM